jgi:hypothetical protein
MLEIMDILVGQQTADYLRGRHLHDLFLTLQK